MDVERVRTALEDAAADLGVRIETRDCWLETKSGDRFELVAIVPDFGSERGMAVLTQWDPAASQLATDRGYGFTVLSRSYEQYDRRLFQDMLNDWQWTGKADPPPWYTGVRSSG